MEPQYDELCESCEAIDLNDAFTYSKAVSSVHGQPIVPLSESTQRWGQSSCRPCRLFGAIYVPLIRDQKTYPNRGHHLRAFNGFALQAKGSKSQATKNPGVVLGIVPGLWRKTLDKHERERCFARGLIAQVPYRRADESSECALKAHLVKASIVDLALIRTWLDLCQASHTSCRLLVTSPSRVRFIDCINRDIILRDNEAADDYLALSYVWRNSVWETRGWTYQEAIFPGDDSFSLTYRFILHAGARLPVKPWR